MNTETRIGVYAICRNEAKFVKKWLENMYCGGKGANRAYVLDTGSTDGTMKAFHTAMKELGIPKKWLVLARKTYKTFRFDAARNDSLALAAPDADKLSALVSVDLDETFIPDFWPDLRAMVERHPDFHCIHYLYAWAHDDDGSPMRVFWYDKVHPPKNCRWKYPVHEWWESSDGTRSGDYMLDENKIYLHHWPDYTKSRGSYLRLLELRAKESPDDIYGLYYLIREYLARDPGSMKALFTAETAYIKITEGSSEDEYDCLPFILLAIADICRRRGLDADAEHYYRRALECGGHLRQPYLDYASFLAYRGQGGKALEMLKTMTERAPNKYPTWYECDHNWTWRPMQIQAVALCWLGQYEAAKSVFDSAERTYIVTKTAREEAEYCGFYRDKQWLEDYLNGKTEAAESEPS